MSIHLAAIYSAYLDRSGVRQSRGETNHQYIRRIRQALESTPYPDYGLGCLCKTCKFQTALYSELKRMRGVVRGERT